MDSVSARDLLSCIVPRPTGDSLDGRHQARGAMLAMLLAGKMPQVLPDDVDCQAQLIAPLLVLLFIELVQIGKPAVQDVQRVHHLDPVPQHDGLLSHLAGIEAHDIPEHVDIEVLVLDRSSTAEPTSDVMARQLG